MHKEATPLPILRILGRDLGGDSSPIVVETEEGRFLVKLRGSAHGTAALVAEVVTGGLADLIGLPVPKRRVLRLEPGTPSDDLNDELADLLEASVGENLGFQFLESPRLFGEEDLDQVDSAWGARVRWLDWLTMNSDRSLLNPNILVAEGEAWLIDHGSALPFHFNWGGLTPESPTAPEPPVPHIFDRFVDHAVELDRELTELVRLEDLIAIVEQVPDSFLRPHLQERSARSTCDGLRMAYADFLWKRLRGEHQFRRSPVPQRDPGPVPDWAKRDR